MGARLLSLLLGLMLGPIGWAIVDPNGPAAGRMPFLDLGVLEGHRDFIGWALLALGIAAVLSAVLPKSGARPKRRGPPVVDFDALPDDSGAEDLAQEPHGDAQGHPVSSSGSPRPSALW